MNRLFLVLAAVSLAIPACADKPGRPAAVASGCRPGSDCVFYQEGKGKFDFVPAGGAKPGN